MGKDLTKRKNTLKIVAATSVAIFSLLSVCTGAFAWFLSERNHSSTSDSFAVESYGRFSSLSFYTLSRTRTESSINYLDFNGGTPIGQITYNWETYSCNTPVGITNISLDQYEPLNPSQPLLAIFALDKDYDTSLEGSIYINASSSKNGYLGQLKADKTTQYNLGDVDDPILVKYENSKYYYPLSSAAGFRFKTFSQAEYDTWISSWTYDEPVGDEEPEYVSGYYTLATNGANAISPSTEKFVEVNNSAETSVFHKDITIVNTGTTRTVKYIAVVIDYDVDAIEYIYSSFLGNPYLESKEYHLNFICDWMWVII